MTDSVELRNEGEVRGAFRARGAVGAAAAQPGKYLGVGSKPFDRLLRAGVIREGAPGSFYMMYKVAPQPRRIFQQALFWIIVILIPILIIQLSGRSGK